VPKTITRLKTTSDGGSLPRPPRRSRSSRFNITDKVELEKLPNFPGSFYFLFFFPAFCPFTFFFFYTSFLVPFAFFFWPKSGFNSQEEKDEVAFEKEG